MMLMPSNHSSPPVHYFAGKYPGRMGWLVGPSAKGKTKLRQWMPYALDNDAFSAWTNRTPWNEGKWREMLHWAKWSVCKPLWALVPDVVADKDATKELWRKYAPEVGGLGFSLAFAAQDGMTPDDVPGDADIVFIGGTTEWKWKSLPMWAKHCRRVHVGRVNGIERLWTCEDYGVESVDGTGWFRDSDDSPKIDRIAQWLAGERPDTGGLLL